jgi:biopolymer transport protein ExbD
MTTRKRETPAPYINVTPLIDVLLVLLIIFMVASPLKPSRFKTFVPEPAPKEVRPNIDTLVVTIAKDLSLSLNGLSDLGSVNDTGKLSAKLADTFLKRRENRLYAEGLEYRGDLSEDDRVLKTVFIKAPRSIHYGDVARVIDGIKGAGAAPIGLQIDGLD